MLIGFLQGFARVRVSRGSVGACKKGGGAICGSFFAGPDVPREPNTP